MRLLQIPHRRCHHLKYNFSHRALSDTKKIKPFSLIPSPKRLPLIGNLHQLQPYGLEKLNDFYDSLHQTFGPIVKLDIGIRLVALFDPDDIKIIFQSEGIYPSRPVFEALKKYRESDPVRYNTCGIFTENGPAWYKLRQACNFILKPTFPSQYLCEQAKVSDDFSLLIKRARNGENEVQDFVPLVYKYTQEAIGVVCFGKRLNVLPENASESFTNPLGVKVEEAVLQTLDSLANTLVGFPWWKMFPTRTYTNLRKNQDLIHNIAMEHFENAKQNQKLYKANKSSKLLLNELACNSELDPRDINSLIMDLFFAGIDATGNALSFLLYHLACHPREQELVYQELTLQYSDEINLANSDFGQKLPYLRACFKESHRLTATAGGTARILDKNCILSGYEVPSGTLCIGINPVISRSGRFFKNPLKFEPERWIFDKKSQTKNHPYLVLPFGHGARRCVGQRIAEQEMYLFIIKLLVNFKVEYLGDPIGSVMKMQLTPDKPLKFKFIDRKQN